MLTGSATACCFARRSGHAVWLVSEGGLRTLGLTVRSGLFAVRILPGGV